MAPTSASVHNPNALILITTGIILFRRRAPDRAEPGADLNPYARLHNALDPYPHQGRT
jgi:hypothetical protein